MEKFGHNQLAALHVLAQIFQHTAAMNKPGFKAPKHTVKTRVEASNPRVHKQFTPLSTKMPPHRYPTRNMNSANLIGVIDDTNFQDVIPKKVPGNTDESATQFANEIIDNITGEALEYQHLITK